MSERLVHGEDISINQLPHRRGVGVKDRLPGPGALEEAVAVALGAQEAIARDAGVEEGCDELQLGEELRLELLKVHHQQPAAEAEPGEGVGCPPGGVARHKLWPVSHKRRREKRSFSRGSHCFHI